MLKKQILLLVISTVIFPVGVYAGSCKDCKVISIGTGPYYGSKCINTNDCAVIRVEGGTFTQAGCNGYSAWHYVFDLSTETGKTVFTQLSIAYTTGALVRIQGAGECNLFQSLGGVEDLSYVYFTP